MDDAAMDDWTFGRGGFAKLYGDRLAQSSLLDRDPVTRWVFIFMLSQADSAGRYRCASVAGLARSAAVSIEQAERAVAELEAPDPDSTTRDEDGRRIVRIPGGWRLVAYARYREYRSPRQVAATERKRRQRERDMSHPSHAVTQQTPDTRNQRADNGERIAAASPRAVEPSQSKGPSKATNGNSAGKERTAAPSWSREACDDWRARFGGTAPGGRIGNALLPLVKTHGWPTVRGAWRSYLEQAEAEYASPQRFAATFGRWNGTGAPARTRVTPTDRMFADAAAFIAAGGSK